MLFVPISPTVHHEPVSPRSRELAELLGRVIEEYEKHHPSVSGSEVRTALRLAARQSSSGGPAAARVVVAAALGALLMVGFVAFFLLQSAGGGGSEAVPVVGVVVALLGIFAVMAVVRRRGG